MNASQAPSFARPPIGRLLVPSLAVTLVFFGFDARYTAAQLSTAKCGVFYDKKEVPGAPANLTGMLALGGLMHELTAAKNCVDNYNAVKACEHYGRALKAVDNVDPALAADFRTDIKAMMVQHNCP